MSPNSPDVPILRQLIQAGDNHVSGEDLAETIGLSRVAVWKRLENLKKSGFEMEAIRRKGYRLKATPRDATEPGILARIGKTHALSSLTLLETSPSTNNEVMRQLAAGVEAPLACLTRRQPGGKGRRGRTWSGDFPENLYASVGFRPNLRPKRLGLLTLWTGLRICRRLATDTKLPIQLKWPNDLYLNGKKLAGILAESTLETDQVTALVMGIGMNINMTTNDLPPDIRESATSLRIALGKSLPLDPIIATVLEETLQAMTDCINGIDEDRLADEWEAYACFQGQRVQILNADGEATSGTLSGIDRAGSLLLRKPSGNLESFRAGDVSLRPDQ